MTTQDPEFLYFTSNNMSYRTYGAHFHNGKLQTVGSVELSHGEDVWEPSFDIQCPKHLPEFVKDITAAHAAHHANEKEQELEVLSTKFCPTCGKEQK